MGKWYGSFYSMTFYDLSLIRWWEMSPYHVNSSSRAEESSLELCLEGWSCSAWGSFEETTNRPGETKVRTAWTWRAAGQSSATGLIREGYMRETRRADCWDQLGVKGTMQRAGRVGWSIAWKACTRTGLQLLMKEGDRPWASRAGLLVVCFLWAIGFMARLKWASFETRNGSQQEMELGRACGPNRAWTRAQSKRWKIKTLILFNKTQ